MKRVVKLTRTWYGIELPDDPEDAMEEIMDFVNQGDPVIVCDEYADLEVLGIYEDEIEIVERE